MLRLLIRFSPPAGDAVEVPDELVPNLQSTLSQLAGADQVPVESVVVTDVRTDQGYMEVTVEMAIPSKEATAALVDLLVCCATSIMGRVQYFESVGDVYIASIQAADAAAYAPGAAWSPPARWV